MKERLSRRRFLAQLGAGLAAPYVLTSEALGAEAKAPASDRVLVGHIGVGGMGGGHLGGTVHSREATSVAVCDLDESRLERAYNVTGQKAERYQDFRSLLDRNDIDAIICATPDHWHALVTITSCEAGKDVYCEKPLCVTVREGRAMVRAARRFERIVQMGTQGRSQSGGRYSAQYVRNGYCGRVREVRCWHYNNPTHPLDGFGDPPPGLDWDTWRGPLPYVRYHPRRCHGTFRWFLENGGGNIRDRGAHIFSIVCWAMNVDATGPVAVEATGTAPRGLYDVPTTMSATWEFKNPDWTLHWDQPGEPQGYPYGCHFIGDRDSLVVGRCDGVGADRKVFFEPKPGEVELYKSNDHRGNFFECVKTRKRPIMDVERGHRVTSLCILGNLAYRIGRKLRWDPEKEEFIGDEAANRLLHYPYRPPWSLRDA